MKTAGTRTNFTAASFIFTSVAERYEEALEASQKGLAYLFRSPAQQSNLEVTGTRLDRSTIDDALVREDWQTVKSLISEEVVHTHTMTGTPEMAADRLQAFVDAGLEIPVLSLRGTPDNRKKALSLLAEQFGPQ